MRRFVLALAAVALLTVPAWAYTRNSNHISSATTTTVVAAVAGQNISVWSLSACVDNAGTATNVTIQDSASTNLIGTNVVYALGAGTCLTFLRSDRNHGPHLVVTSGLGLQVVTSAAGPVEVSVEFTQQ